LENFIYDVVVNRAWKTTGGRSLGYHELKQHKPWFNERYSRISDQRTQAILQWYQEPRQINGDNLNMKLADIPARIKGNIWKGKLTNLQHAVRTRTLKTYVDVEATP
jgi:hypothetical protein